MKEVIVTQHNKVYTALVDDEDFERCIQRKWTLTTFGYAVSRVPGKTYKQGYYIQMHQFIINGLVRKGLIDHIDRNKLNNQKANLRIADKSINTINRGMRSDNTSGFRGVFWDKTKSNYLVQIMDYGKLIYIGRFKNKEEAAQAYNKAAIKYHGEFAFINKL